MLTSADQSAGQQLRRIGGVEWATALLITLGVALRFVYLDADLHYYEWIGYITDEGRWIHHARSAFLQGGLDRDPVYDLHLLLAPLYQALNFLTFEIAGLSRWSSRVLTAAFGSALLLVFWRSLRPVLTPRALLVGVLLLAVQVDFVMLSRVAVPEMVIVCFQALIFFSLLSPKRAAWQMVFPAVLLLIGMAMKGTLAVYVPIFAAVLLFLPDENAAPPHRRWPNLAWFLTGLAVPIGIAAVGLVAIAEVGAPTLVTGHVITTLLGFLTPARLYDILEFPIDDTLSPAFNYLALGLWISWLGTLTRPAGGTPGIYRRYLAASSVWIVGYFVIMLVLAYFPQRYRVHIILPMVINVSLGWSLLESRGRNVHALPVPASVRSDIVRTVLLAFPTAVLLAPLLAFAARIGGADVHALRVPYLSVIVALAAVLLVVWRHRASGTTHAFLLAFPIVAAGIWAICSAVTHSSFWPFGVNRFGDGVWLVLLLGSVAAGLAWAAASPERGPSVRSLMYIYGGSFLVMSLVRLAPAYLWPQYSIRDASRELGVMLAGADRVASSRAEGLFTDNRLVYERFDLDAARPDAVVSVFRMYPLEREVLDREYQLVKSFPLYAPPDYFLVHHDPQPVALLFKRRQSSPLPSSR